MEDRIYYCRLKKGYCSAMREWDGSRMRCTADYCPIRDVGNDSCLCYNGDVVYDHGKGGQ